VSATLSSPAGAATTDAPRVADPGAGSRRWLPWSMVVALAVLMAYADGFWVVSLQGAVGAIERAQSPFLSWLVGSTAAVPLFALAVVGALKVARRWFGPTLLSTRRVLATALLIVTAGTTVGIGAAVAGAVYDYHLQRAQVEGMLMRMHVPGTPMTDMPVMNGIAGECDTECTAMRDTLAVDERAVAYGAGVMLLTNLVVVGWVVAMRGGRVDVARRVRRQAA